MKVKRHKRVKKTLGFYKNHFGLESPYHVLADGTFCKAALTWKLNIMDQLPKYFEAEVKMFTTKCTLAECEMFGSLLYGPLKILQGYTIQSCNHPTPIQASKCLYNTARLSQGSSTFIVATCDQDLTQKVNNTSGLPLLYISHSTITLQAPSHFTQQVAEKCEKQRLLIPSEKQQQTLTELNKKEFGDVEENVTRKRKRKGPKGPNPLSCKKKKLDVVKVKVEQPSNKKKRNRKRHKKLVSVSA